MEKAGQIYTLIGQAMGKIRAIGKDSESRNVSGKVMYKYRGIDAVYNALNPVMAELGLFIVPEILDQKREERTSANGAKLVYTILTIRYTMYAPDGSNIQMTVVGEGMDSGDKSANKAMSVGLKYACFQLFMIPTDEMIDPDGEVNDLGNGKKAPEAGQKPAPDSGTNKNPPKPQNAPQGGKESKSGVSVAESEKVPEPNPAPKPPAKMPNPAVVEYIKKQIEQLQEAMEYPTFEDAKKAFEEMRNGLMIGGAIERIPYADMTLEQAQDLVRTIHESFLASEGARA